VSGSTSRPPRCSTSPSSTTPPAPGGERRSTSASTTAPICRRPATPSSGPPARRGCPRPPRARGARQRLRRLQHRLRRPLLARSDHRGDVAGSQRRRHGCEGGARRRQASRSRSRSGRSPGGPTPTSTPRRKLNPSSAGGEHLLDRIDQRGSGQRRVDHDAAGEVLAALAGHGRRGLDDDRRLRVDSGAAPAAPPGSVGRQRAARAPPRRPGPPRRSPRSSARAQRVGGTLGPRRTRASRSRPRAGSARSRTERSTRRPRRAPRATWPPSHSAWLNRSGIDVPRRARRCRARRTRHLFRPACETRRPRTRVLRPDRTRDMGPGTAGNGQGSTTPSREEEPHERHRPAHPGPRRGRRAVPAHQPLGEARHPRRAHPRASCEP
jgi:hypothetical protein